MTEKRFENRLNKDKKYFNTINPVYDNKKEDALNVFDMIEELNELAEENEQLKSELSEKDIQLDFLKAENIHMSNLVNENKQLKQEIKVLRDYGTELLEYINSPPKHRKNIFDAVICFKNKKR